MVITRENQSFSRVVKSKEKGLYPIRWRRKMLMHVGLNL